MELGRVAVSLPAGALSARECVDLAARAEREWGYDAIWLAETAGPDSFSLAAALFEATEAVTIGTAIVPVYNRTPAVLAMSAATLAELSGGRFVLGLGSSSHAIVEEWNGIPFKRPLGHVRESVELVRQALREAKTDYGGELFRSRGFRLGNQTRERVPIYVAALREKMLELAGEVGEGLILNLFPRTATPMMLDAYRRGAERAGRDASRDEVVCRFMVCVTDDVPKARDTVRATFGGYAATPVYNKFFAWCGFEDQARAVASAFAKRDRAGVYAAMDDSMVDQISILGSAESCREQVAAFVEAGVTTPVLSPLASERAGVEAVWSAFAPALR
jgi:probable F420-dependent oxidoreductase